MFEPLPLGFPTGGGTTANPSPKSGKVCFLLIFGRFFHLPNGASKFTSKKHRKMSENRTFCSPKTLPKCIQNRFPKKHAIFDRFLHAKTLCRKHADIDSVLVFTILFACRTHFFKTFFAYILVPKCVPKTLPKRGPNPQKIDAKNVLVFNIDFLAFWLRF